MSDCRAETLVRSEKFIVFALEGATPFWKLFSSKQRILKVTVNVDTHGQEKAVLSNVTVRIEPLHLEGPCLDPSLLNVRPLVLRHIRSVLQVAPERRLSKRRPCNFGVKLYPLLPDWKFDQVIEGRASDLSASGVALTIPKEPLTDRVYLRPNAPSPLNDFAILAKTVRKKPLPDGSYAIGAIFGQL